MNLMNTPGTPMFLNIIFYILILKIVYEIR